MPSAPTAAAKHLGRRQHVGQGVGGIGDGVDVEEHRARDMCGSVLLACIPPGKVPRPVDHHDAGIGKTAGKPPSGNEPARTVGHGESFLPIIGSSPPRLPRESGGPGRRSPAPQPALHRPTWIPAFAGKTEGRSPATFSHLIPSSPRRKPGSTLLRRTGTTWIPAFAGMTRGAEWTRGAGMTRDGRQPEPLTQTVSAPAGSACPCSPSWR